MWASRGLLEYYQSRIICLCQKYPLFSFSFLQNQFQRLSIAFRFASCRFKSPLPRSPVCCDWSACQLCRDWLNALHVNRRIHTPRSCKHCGQPGGATTAPPTAQSDITLIGKQSLSTNKPFHTLLGAFSVGANTPSGSDFDSSSLADVKQVYIQYIIHNSMMYCTTQHNL